MEACNPNMRTVRENEKTTIENPLPDLREIKLEMISDGRHPSWYAQGLGHWTDFERDVQEKMAHIPWKEDGFLSTQPDNPQENPVYTDTEQHLCGGKQSIAESYSDNGLRSVASVARNRGINIRFGDFKMCQESKSDAAGHSTHHKQPDRATVPDFIALDIGPASPPSEPHVPVKPEMRMIGEVMTPWKHSLPKYCEDYTAEKEDGSTLRRGLGEFNIIKFHMFLELMTYTYTWYRPTCQIYASVWDEIWFSDNL